MDKSIKFAEINELPLNEYFKTEYGDFTPWLKDNIEIIGDAIGIDIEDAETEVPVGNYRLDILAYESGSDRKIAIENQFEKTDHKHLGQLITYMAGIDAEVVVWIAENFNTEHITAINHLNQISNENIAFFCIRPRLIKIGSSEPAIEFVTITKPDEWEKQVKNETKVSERGMKYKKFWTALIEKYKQIYPEYKFGQIYPTRSNCVLSYSGAKIEYNVRFRKGSVFITLYLGTNSKPDPHEIIDRIISRKSGIEGELGLELEIEKKDNIKSTCAEIKYVKDVDILTISEKEKEDLISWIIEWLPKFKNILDPIVKEVQAES